MAATDRLTDAECRELVVALKGWQAMVRPIVLDDRVHQDDMRRLREQLAGTDGLLTRLAGKIDYLPAHWAEPKPKVEKAKKRRGR